LLELNCSRSAAPVIVLPFDCCMVRVQVYGVDVGHGQVMGSIAQDPRVTVMERINLRHLKPEQLPEQVSTFWQGQCSSLAACTAAQTSQDGLCAGRRHPCKCASAPCGSCASAGAFAVNLGTSGHSAAGLRGELLSTAR
jgi:hypothetical protein